MKWFFLAIGVLSNAIASAMIKFSMMAPFSTPSLRQPITILRNPPFIVGIMLYGVALIFYSASLKYLPLKVAHPIMTSGAMSVVAILSIFVLKEEFSWFTVLGLFLVASGVVVLSYQVN